MPEYDAFGREIGEDTLAGLGGDPRATPTPTPAPAPVPADGWSGPPDDARPEPAPAFSAGTETPAAPAPPSFSSPGEIPLAGRPPKARRGIAGLGCLISLVVLAVVVAGPIIAIVAFVDDAADTIDSVRDEVGGAADGGTVTSPGEDRPPPTGLTGRSMLRPANLAGAIEVLRREDGRLGRLVLWPDRANAELVTRRDNERNVVLTHDGELRRGDPVDVGIPQDVVGWDRIDPAVPARFARAAAKRFGLDAGRIDYVIGEKDVFDGEPLRWVAYFKGGAIVQGDADGRVERRIS